MPEADLFGSVDDSDLLRYLDEMWCVARFDTICTI